MKIRSNYFNLGQHSHPICVVKQNKLRQINSAGKLIRAGYVNPLTNPIRLSFLLHLRKYKHEI